MTKIDISKGIVLEVDFSRIMAHEELVARAVRFAVKQALTNTHAGISKKKFPDLSEAEIVAQSRAVAEKRLEAMYGGDWAQAERGPRGDAVEKEMRAMAEAAILAKLPQIGKKRKDFSTEVWNGVIAKQLAANEAAYRKAAEAKLAIKPEVEEDEDDLLAMLAEADGAADEESESGDDE